ncbi:MAG TPA: response regulator [Euryarchaeota archaeon]|nr:MAG: response regulator [Thermoplasmatales archaeon ex4484_6]RLF65308.1 MAG: response regulator [Thermoplasmata archaeon]HHD15801.1 response regulator [Euryarchaeota archaeon]
MDRTILIVEDRDSISEVIGEMLTLNGWNVVGRASSGEEALEMFRERRPGTVLMDILLPDMSGLDAARDMLREAPECRIFAMSAMTEPGIRERVLDAGCRELLVKPFRMRELVGLLEDDL